MCRRRRESGGGILPEEVRKKLEEEVGVSLEGSSEGIVKEHRIKLDYKYHTAEYVLKELLPDGMETPSAFEQVGHVGMREFERRVLAV